MNNDSAEARLQRWKQRWEVVDPDICCRVCGGTQSMFVPYGAFNRHHVPGCSMQSDLPQHPKEDLVQILQALNKEL